MQSTWGCVPQGSLGEEDRALHPSATTAVQAAAPSDQNTSSATQDSKGPPHLFIDAHHSCKGSPLRCLIAWVSEAHAHRTWLTLWGIFGMYTQHLVPSRAHTLSCDAVRLAKAMRFWRATFHNWYTFLFKKFKESCGNQKWKRRDYNWYHQNTKDSKKFLQRTICQDMWKPKGNGQISRKYITFQNSVKKKQKSWTDQ